MNALTEIPSPQRDAHRRAIDDVNRWRGRMVNLFAQGEMVIAQALKARSGTKQLPMLLSQRVARLLPLIEQEKKAVGALAKFEALAESRNAIVHGAGKIYLDRDGKWLLTLQSVGRTGVTTSNVAQDNAENQDKELKAVVDRLSAAFRS